jgi:hypothetical protein
MEIFSEKACFKKPVLPEKPVKKPAFNLPAGFFNKTWVFSSPVYVTNVHKEYVNYDTKIRRSNNLIQKMKLSELFQRVANVLPNV